MALGFAKKGKYNFTHRGEGLSTHLFVRGVYEFPHWSTCRAERPRKECGRQEIQHVESESGASLFWLLQRQSISLQRQSASIVIGKSSH